MKKKERIMKFGDMLDALMKAHKNIRNKKYGYDGPVFTSNSMLCTSPNIDTQFSKEEVEFRIQHKDKTPLELVISAAIQLGIQQGIYMCSDNPHKYLEIQDFPAFEKEIQYLNPDNADAIQKMMDKLFPKKSKL